MIGVHSSFSNLYRFQFKPFFVNGACSDQFLTRLKTKMGSGLDLGGSKEPPKEMALLRMA